MVSFGFSHPGDQQQWMGYVAEILYLMCTYQKIIVPNLFIYQCQCVQTWGLGYGKWDFRCRKGMGIGGFFLIKAFRSCKSTKRDLYSRPHVSLQ